MCQFKFNDFPPAVQRVFGESHTLVVMSYGDDPKVLEKVRYRGVLESSFAVVLDKHADGHLAPLCFADNLWTEDGRWEFEIDYDGQIIATDHEWEDGVCYE